MKRLIIYLLSGLSPKLRRRFVLRNEKNLLEKEIAEMEGVTPQAICKSLKRQTKLSLKGNVNFL